MRRTRFDDWPCPIARATDLIGDWWTPLVLREALLRPPPLRGVSRRELDVPRAILARRGSTASSSEGLVTKVRVRRAAAPLRVPPHRQGPRASGDVLAAMWRWGDDWLLRGTKAARR